MHAALASEAPLRPAQAFRVRASAQLGGPQPRYAFTAWLEVGVGSGAFREFGPAEVAYPEAAMNCNDMADLINRDP